MYVMFPTSNIYKMERYVDWELVGVVQEFSEHLEKEYQGFRKSWKDLPFDDKFIPETIELERFYLGVKHLNDTVKLWLEN